MKTIIIFASSHGTTLKAATILSGMVGDNVPIIDLRKNKEPDIKEFDAVLIGGSIHAGMMQRKVTKFIQQHEKELLTKKIGLFLCCMYEGEQATTQFEQAYPESLRNHSTANGLFGGEFLFGKMNFLEKAIIKKLKGDTQDSSTLNEKAIYEFAQTFQTNNDKERDL